MHAVKKPSTSQTLAKGSVSIELILSYEIRVKGLTDECPLLKTAKNEK